jgi:hypothetical protein
VLVEVLEHLQVTHQPKAQMVEILNFLHIKQMVEVLVGVTLTHLEQVADVVVEVQQVETLLLKLLDQQINLYMEMLLFIEVMVVMELDKALVEVEVLVAMELLLTVSMVPMVALV